VKGQGVIITNYSEDEVDNTVQHFRERGGGRVHSGAPQNRQNEIEAVLEETKNGRKLNTERFSFTNRRYVLKLQRFVK